MEFLEMLDKYKKQENIFDILTFITVLMIG